MSQARVHVGIGSNIDRKKNIDSGLAALESYYGKLELSPVYEARSIGFDGDDFYNLVAAFNTEKTIDEVETELRQIELNHGRCRDENRFSSRTLDIDILLYDDLISSKHKVPREDIVKYAFVIKPLFDLSPDLVHPETGQSIEQLWHAFEFNQAELKQIEYSPAK